MKINGDAVRKLEEVFAIDGSVEEACYYANISRQTYYDWIKNDPAKKVKFDRLRNKPVLKARMAVIKGLDCYSNSMDYLKRKKKLEFGDNIDVTTEGKALPQSIINLKDYESIQGNNSNTEDIKTEEED